MIYRHKKGQLERVGLKRTYTTLYAKVLKTLSHFKSNRGVDAMYLSFCGTQSKKNQPGKVGYLALDALKPRYIKQYTKVLFDSS